MRFYICITILLITMSQAFAECSPQEIRNMINQGFSNSEIDSQCTKLVIDINGEWQFMSNSKYGGVYEFWNIASNNGSVVIQAFRGNRWVPMTILKQTIRGNSLKFTVKESPTTKVFYDLTILSDDLIEGVFKATDTKFKGMMPQDLISVPIGDGSTKYGGPVRLTKQ